MQVAWFYGAGLWVAYPAVVILILAAGEIGDRLGLRQARRRSSDIGGIAGAALGLLALLIGFSFSMSLTRYDDRIMAALEEANAIGSTANFALMLPPQTRSAELALLRDYSEARLSLGSESDPAQIDRIIARSVELQGQMWQKAVELTAAAPQSLPSYRFVGSLNEVNNVHERRMTALRNHVPIAVVLMLIAVAMVAMGFSGFASGASGARRRIANVIMAATIAAVIIMIIDLDGPAAGLIRVPNQAMRDLIATLPAQ